MRKFRWDKIGLKFSENVFNYQLYFTNRHLSRQNLCFFFNLFPGILSMSSNCTAYWFKLFLIFIFLILKKFILESSFSLWTSVILCISFFSWWIWIESLSILITFSENPIRFHQFSLLFIYLINFCFFHYFHYSTHFDLNLLVFV